MNWWRRNSNTIFTIAEIIGFVGTVVTVTKAAIDISNKPEIKALNKKVVEKEELVTGVTTERLRDKTIKEKSAIIVKACFPECITPLIFTTVTIGAMACCKKQYASQAAIASGYTLAKRMYDENKEKVQEVINEINSIDKTDPNQFDNIEVSRNGDPKDNNDIFMFEWSGRRFKSSVPCVDEAIELCKEHFKKRGCISFNNIYLYNGINESKIGVENGFADMGRMNHPELPDNEWADLDMYRQEVEGPDGRVIHMICVDNNVEWVWWFQTLLDHEEDSLIKQGLL